MDVSTRRNELYGLLGELPPRDRPIGVELVSAGEFDGYWLETLSLDLNGIERVPAYFARPLALDGPAPTVLYHHAHGGKWEIGKEELIRPRSSLVMPPYAKALTGQGYCVLCADTWNFGERRGRTESELFKEMILHGQVLWGMMVYDSLRAVDYLATRPEVDMSRLATLGMSMGSTMAWWLAALEERIKVTVDICCLTDLEELIRTRGLDGHGIYYFVPGLLKYFSTADINALIAPRPHLGIAGNLDLLTPPAGLDRIDAHLKAVYAAQGVPERWQLLRYETGHLETQHGRARILEFLNTWL
jgi:hypothetical protein